MAVTQYVTPVSTARRSAVAWIGDAGAIVARMSREGGISTCEIERSDEPGLSFLAIVVRAIGDRERVVILGPGEMRLALERQYVESTDGPSTSWTSSRRARRTWTESSSAFGRS